MRAGLQFSPVTKISVASVRFNFFKTPSGTYLNFYVPLQKSFLP